MNCPYCGVAFNIWVKNIPNEKKSNEYSSYVINYIEEKLLSGSFKISELSKKFIEAEKFLTSSNMQAALQVGAEFAIDKWLEDDVVDNKEFDLYSKYMDEWEKVLTTPVSKVICPDGGKKLMYGQILYYLRSKGLEGARGLGFSCMQPNSQIMISKGEEFIFRSNLLCAGSILNVKTRYAGHSTGASYQLTKKTRIRHSQHRGKPISMMSGTGLDWEIAITTNISIFLVLRTAEI